MKLEEANKRYAAYHRFKNNWLGWVFAIPTIILMYIFIWRPIVIGIAYSFFELKGYTPVRFIGLENYRQILSDTNFIQVLTNTFKYCGWSLLFSYFTPLIIAVMVNEMVRSKGYFKFTLYLPTMIPMVACCMLFKMIYFDDAGGLINMVITKLGGSRIGLIDPDTGKRLDNTEFEYGVYGDDIIINCCNYEYRAPKKFKVYIDGAEQKCKITELRSMKECENSTVELPSVLPIMIKIEGAAKLIK